MKAKLKKLLTEWKLDCEQVERKFNEKLPQHDLIVDALTYPDDKLILAKLGRFLQEEMINDIGVMPERNVVIKDVYSESAFGFSLREEWHAGYWMLQEQIERGDNNG